MTGVLIKRVNLDTETDTDTLGGWHEDTGRMPPTSQELQRPLDAKRKAWDRFSLTALRRN
jgi:hypothetical protein